MVLALVAVSPKEATPEVIQMTWRFTENIPQHPDSNLIGVLGYFPDFKANVASTAVLDTRGVEMALRTRTGPISPNL